MRAYENKNYNDRNLLQLNMMQSCCKPPSFQGIRLKTE